MGLLTDAQCKYSQQLQHCISISENDGGNKDFLNGLECLVLP